MKITMYELLGLVKDGKVPKKFKYDSYVWTYDYKNTAYWNENDIEFEDYMNNRLIAYLDDEVEIIEEEEKKIEHIDLSEGNCISLKEDKIQMKINEIIDHLNSKGE